MRVWLVPLSVSLTLIASGCSGSDGTDLTIRVSNAYGEHRYQLRCNPADGVVPHPAALCDLLRAHSETMLSEKEPQQICGGGPGTIYLQVNGRYEGESVDAAVSACAGNAEAERLWLSKLPPPPEPQ